MFFNCDEIKKRMNKAGKARSPFLFAVDFEMREGFFITDPLSQREVLFDVKGISNSSPPPPYLHPGNYLFEAFPEDYQSYLRRFNIVMEGLRRGDSYLANLTIKTPLHTSLSPEEIFHLSRATYKLYLPGKWICFSPECFVRIAQGKISTYPMKGTIDARRSNARETILNDPKETAEHNTIVDLLRNDLSRIATSVKVNRFRYIDELKTNRGPILQVSSEIEGILEENYLDNLGTLFFELLPAGSVSGAPKEATLRLIREAEKEPRGFYTGVAGYFDGKVLESFVLIRFIGQQGSQLFFRSGGGITANSNSRKEYDEAIQKVYLPF
ncbi:aminodeoxychorismate synthase component I [Proteiniphilum sp.]|uniref:aminodeoxychorismate synthase component I n=1 Tax=Proteiniphilum sp. TaxID=1926877 RepID=UPI00332A2BF0